jgi:serine/threonine-protein kinase
MSTSFPSGPDTSLESSFKARLRALEHAWEQHKCQGPPPRWQDYLPPQGEHCPTPYCFSLLATDIECRVAAGLPALLAEPYFADERARAVAADASLLLELVRREYSQRWQRGERARRQDYLERFPHLQELRKLCPTLKCPSCTQEAVLREEDDDGASCPLCGCRIVGPITAPITRPPAPANDPATAPPPLADASTDPWATRAPPITDIGTEAPRISSTQRFRIIRPHARGGLGTIFLASDQELHREVALKEIQDRHAYDPDSRARFLLEAEVTGGLEHPGIVPVYSLGHYPDGRPYYAMRFIKGDSLKEAIDRFHANADLKRQPGNYTLALRELLGRFVTVCNAVGYAHSRGFIHRDIKPANVMLGSYGETLVVDWGLAKAMRSSEGTLSTQEVKGPLPAGSDSAQTMEGSAVGTPQYMSPEQAAGELGRLGPASDVYSLGATLYSILTGHAPVNGPDVLTILLNVTQGDFLPPRQVNASVPQALEAVVLKAMALRSEDRYQSALALAADVEHWLADEPVAAWKEPWSVRTRRWVKHHRTWVMAAAAAVAVAVTALIAATVLLTAAAERERAAKELAQQNEQDARVQRAEAEKQRDEAKTQRDLAENNFKLARDAVDRYHTKVSENRLLNEPGLQPLRKELLETALEFYDRFVQERKDDPSVQADLARALGRVAAITNEIGSKTKAIEKRREALALWQKVDREHPGIADYQDGLAGCYRSLGDLYDGIGDMKKALECYQQAAAASEKLNHDHPGNIVYQRDWAVGLGLLSNVYQWFGRMEEAEVAKLASVKIMKDRARANPKNLNCTAGAAQSQMLLGALYGRRGKIKEAEAAFREALETMAGLIEQRPKVAMYRGFLAQMHLTMSFYLIDRKEWDRAEEAIHAALLIWEKLVQERPSEREYLEKLAEACRQRVMFNPEVPGKVAADKHIARAEAAHRQGTAALERLVRESPTVTRYQEQLAELHSFLVLRYRQLGRTEKQEAAQLQANAILKKLVDDNPDVIGFRKQLGDGLGNLAHIYLAAKNYTKAEEAFLQARSVWEKLCEKGPEKSDTSSPPEKSSSSSAAALSRSYPPYMLAATWDGLAQVYMAMERISEAKAAYLKELEVRAQLVADYSEDSSFQELLAMSLYLASIANEKAGELDEAIALVGRSLRIYQELARKEPDQLKHRAEAADRFGRIGFLNGQARRFVQGEEAYKQALRLREGLVEKRPELVLYRRVVGNTHDALGALYMKARRWQDAEAEYLTALEIQGKLAARDGKNADSQNALAFAHNSLAELYLKLNRFDEAEAAFQQARAIWERLAQAAPTVPRYTMLWAWMHTNKGRVALSQDQLTVAEQWCARAIDILEPVLKDHPKDALVRNALSTAHWCMANALFRLHRLPESLKHWDRAIEIGAAEIADPCRLGRAELRAAQGERVPAVAEARELAAKAPEKESILANAGYVYSEALAAVFRDSTLNKDQREKLAQEYGAAAVSLLTRAYAVEDRVTPAVVRSLKRDKLLDPLRTRDDFKHLLDSLELKLQSEAPRPRTKRP